MEREELSDFPEWEFLIMKWEFLINPNSYESESSSHAMPKRKATKKQLRNLDKGRAIRKSNLLKKRRQKRRPKPKRKMTKRRRPNASLTGGTGDVNPQILTLSWEHPLAIPTHNVQFHSPVAKGLFAQRNYATVMEILKVWFFLPNYESPPVAGLVLHLRRCLITTTDLGTTIGDARLPTVLAICEDTESNAFTAAQGYSTNVSNVKEFDLTDGVGHGLLLATDYIYLQSRLYPAYAG